MSAASRHSSPPYAVGDNLEESRGGHRWRSLRRRAVEAGWGSAIRLAAQYAVGRTLYGPVHRGRTFSVGERRYSYLASAAHTERAVEIPVAQAFVAEGGSTEPILEIGNVLNRYAPFPHPVVDKYEVGPGILNRDLFDYAPATPVRRILSVSTLEHVGFDERPQRRGRFEPALQHLVERCLAREGELLVTVPLGYNPEVDAWLRRGAPLTGELHLLRRRSALNLWEEQPAGEAPPSDDALAFDRRYPGAAALVIWRYRRP